MSKGILLKFSSLILVLACGVMPPAQPQEREIQFGLKLRF